MILVLQSESRTIMKNIRVFNKVGLILEAIFLIKRIFLIISLV